MINIHGLTKMMKREMHQTEILEKYVDMEMSCLSETDKKEVMDMLYKYKDAFTKSRGNRYMCKHKSRNRCNK